MKDIYRRDDVQSIPISKFGFKTKSGVTKILVSSRFLVTHDKTQFLAFAFPSLDFRFRRELNISDAALEGDHLFVSTDVDVTIWDLVKKRKVRTMAMPLTMVGGTRRLLFPYLFYRCCEGGEQQPNQWHYMVLDAVVESPPKQTGLEMETCMRLVLV